MSLIVRAFVAPFLLALFGIIFSTITGATIGGVAIGVRRLKLRKN